MGDATGGDMESGKVMLAVRGTPVRAYRGGQGRPLVLLHGGGLDSALLTWQPAWASLTRLGHVLAPDLPGYGASPLGPTVPTLPGYRGWLLDFLDAAGVRSAVVAGLSLGGGVAIQAALDAPERVDGLLLCAPYGVSPRLPGGRAGYLEVRAPSASAMTYALLRHSDWLLRRALESLVHRPAVVDAQMLRQVRELLHVGGAGAAWSRFQRHEVRWPGPRTCWRGELSAIRVPAAFLAGEYDRSVPAADVRTAAHRLPRGSFEMVAGAGHWLPREAPGQIVSAASRLLHEMDAVTQRHPQTSDGRPR
jgi:pimeloyl-ACP methyl ester carboxylesterase